MTLMQRLTRSTTHGTYTATENTQAPSVGRVDLMVEQGFVLRHVYGLGDRCPNCGARLQRQEWGGKRFTPTVGLNVCRCGFVSQQFTIA